MSIVRFAHVALRQRLLGQSRTNSSRSWSHRSSGCAVRRSHRGEAPGSRARRRRRLERTCFRPRRCRRPLHLSRPCFQPCRRRHPRLRPSLTSPAARTSITRAAAPSRALPCRSRFHLSRSRPRRTVAPPVSGVPPVALPPAPFPPPSLPPPDSRAAGRPAPPLPLAGRAAAVGLIRGDRSASDERAHRQRHDEEAGETRERAKGDHPKRPTTKQRFRSSPTVARGAHVGVIFPTETGLRP